MPIEHLVDLDDPRLAWYRGVRDPQLLANGGRFVAEGRAVVARLLADPRWAVESVLVSPAALEALGGSVARRPDVATFVLDVDRLVTLAGYNIHRGCLAVAWRGPALAASAIVPCAPAPAFVLGLEGLADADNVGGCFRGAAAFGIDAVLLDGACADPLYRKAVRTSMAASLCVPFARVSTFADALPWLREQGVLTVALTPGEHDADLMAARHDLAGAARIALLVGNEGRGLRPETLDACDRRVRIAMRPDVDSLNAATAATLALHAVWTARPLS